MPYIHSSCNRYIITFFLLNLMLMTGSIFGQNSPQPAAAAELPNIVLPPELDRVLRDYERAWSTGDAAALALLFADDGFVLQSNRAPIRGRQAIQAAYEGQGGSPLRLRPLAFAVEGTVGFIIGAYGYDNMPGVTGKFTVTLRRAPGEPWLIFSDMDNAGVPSQETSISDTPL